MVTNMAPTRGMALDQSIMIVIDRFIAQAEIERRQLVATRREAEDYMRRQRKNCMGEHGAECREAVTHLGFDPNNDEYWENMTLPEYGKVLGEVKLFRAVIVEQGMEGATNEELIAMRKALPGESHQNAVIVWHDRGLERTYQTALRSE